MTPSAPLVLSSLLALALGASACSPGKSREEGKPAPTTGAAAPQPPAPARIVADLVDQVAGCDLEHRGLLLDTGTDAMVGRFAWSGVAPKGVDPIEHDASTWMRVSNRTLRVVFHLPEPSPIFVAARSMGLGARAATVSLDDQPLGTLNFQRDQIRIATTGATSLPVDPGLHTLTFRFMGRARSGDPLVDLDWIRVGVPDESTATFGPPTLRDVILPQAALSAVPHRSIALRGPGAVRCTLRLPPGARLRVSVGVLGPGEADARVRLLRDGQKPVDVLTQHLTGGDKATWTDLDVPLDPQGGPLATLELPRRGHLPGRARPLRRPGDRPARRSSACHRQGARRRPRRHERPRPRQPPALACRPHAPAPHPLRLALTATTFHRHRAPTTFPGSVVGSLLTAMPPRAHTLTDFGARMPASNTTLGAVAHDASIRAALFTGVPATFKSFGFGEGWEHFAEYPPYGNDPATAPLDAAASWLTEVLRQSPEARLLLVVHARGGHPPWDVSPKEIAQLPPSTYTGVIEPRRGAQQLATLRKKKDKKDALSAQDQERIRALEGAAMAAQDRALGGLVAALKTAGVWESTVFVVTGDVAAGASALYAEGDDLAEPRLTLPLYVRFPDARYGGAHVNLPTEVWDLSQTTLSALGISFSRPGLGRDLSAVASGLEDSSFEPQIATLDDRFSARWGELIMTGRYDAAPFLCDLELDPTCAFNRRETLPLAAMALFRRVMARDQASRSDLQRREPATIDPDTAAALRVWGTIE